MSKKEEIQNELIRLATHHENLVTGAIGEIEDAIRTFHTAMKRYDNNKDTYGLYARVVECKELQREIASRVAAMLVAWNMREGLREGADSVDYIGD